MTCKYFKKWLREEHERKWLEDIRITKDMKYFVSGRWSEYGIE